MERLVGFGTAGVGGRRARMEKLTELVSGKLSALVEGGLSGHHPLFANEEIRAACSGPDAPVSRDEAGDVGRALLAISRDPFHVARGAVEELPAPARDALIRVYFRLLYRAREGRGALH